MSDREIMEAKGLGGSNNKYPQTRSRFDLRTDTPNNLIEGWKYKDTKINHMPDQYKHKQLSLVKSAIRILGYGGLWFSFDLGVTLLILAEVVGIGEELV